MLFWMRYGFLVMLCVFLALSPHSAVHGAGLPPGAVIYGVVPTLFGKKPFRDVTESLEYLRDQGVDVIWLSPVNESDDKSAISYAVTNHFGLRSDFGTEEEFRGLIQKAHDLGMKVIMDFVPNHTSNAHPYFQEAQEKKELSLYYEFYARGADGQAEYYFDWSHLPNLNYDHPGVVDMISKAFTYWVKEFDVDGFRVDVAWGVRERSPDFWPALIKELRSIKPGTIMLAEASAEDLYYSRNGFDLAYDWTETLGEWAWKDAFQDSKKTGRRLHKALTSSQTPAHARARYLNNNDTGTRFISVQGIERTRVAAVLQHTLPGTPVLYTGDEIGAEYRPYEDPEPLEWGDSRGLRGFYRKLAQLREDERALAQGDWRPVMPENTEAAYAYLRSYGKKDWVLVVLNFDVKADVKLKLPRPIVAAFKNGEICDLLSDEKLHDFQLQPDSRDLTVFMKARSAKLLKPCRPRS